MAAAFVIERNGVPLIRTTANELCVTTFDGIVDDCNSTFAAMLGCNRTDLIGVQISEHYVRPNARAECRIAPGVSARS